MTPPPSLHLHSPWARLWSQGFGGFARLVGELFAPRACAACDAPLPLPSVFCGACAPAVESLPQAEPLAFGSYGGPLAEALKRFKYGERPDLQAQLGSLLVRACAGRSWQGWVLAPVPLHASRLRERGYNQAALLGSVLAGDLAGVAWRPRLLCRVRSTEKQALLDRDGRALNVQGAFALRRPSEVEGGRVLLVDDVCTSGATLEACRQVLLEAGASEVRACVVARTLG